MSFQNTFHNTNNDSNPVREYFNKYNNCGTGLSTISNTIYYYIWTGSGKESSSPPVNNSRYTSSHSYTPNLENLGVSCICTEDNSSLRN